MKRWITIGVLGLLLASWLAPGGHSAPRVTLQDFMQIKLKHSQNVLQGLVQEDFDAIVKHSEAMSLLSLAATWQVFQTPEYIEYSRKFRNSADKLTDMAKKKNLEKATTAFNEMTVRCVECHKYVRGVRMAEKGK